MDRKSMKIAVLSALCGCAGFGREARQEPVERLDEHGVRHPSFRSRRRTFLRSSTPILDLIRSTRMIAPSCRPRS